MRQTVKRHAGSAKGMTLLELLVVLSILSLLVQLLLPALQAAREAARRGQCLSQLRQLSLACQLHHDTHGHLPAGGWTHVWVGDPRRGFGENQPGGWAFNLLPFLEESALRELATGADEPARWAAARRLLQTPNGTFICPSRRAVQAYPFLRYGTLQNSDNPDSVARTDYAANMGNLTPNDQRASGPASYEESALWQDGDDPESEWVATRHNGVIYQRSTVAYRQVTDGLSGTLLLGEKFLSPAHYASGLSNGDDQAVYCGFDRDLARSTNAVHPPLTDEIVPDVWLRVGDSADVKDWNFGSAHPVGFGITTCDGSARFLAYGVDPELFSALGSRNGEELVRVR